MSNSSGTVKQLCEEFCNINNNEEHQFKLLGKIMQ
jgi:hypothetical protein